MDVYLQLRYGLSGFCVKEQFNIMRQTLFFILLSLALPLGAAPKADLGSNIQLPHKKFVLKNGLTLIVHEDHKAPIVAVNVWYHVGSKNEKPGKTGFAHLFEHLMFNGSEHFDDDYFKAMEKVGATDLNGTTSEDRTIRLWDPNIGQERATLAGHTDAVYFGVFLPDGNALLSAGREGALKVWLAPR